MSSQLLVGTDLGTTARRRAAVDTGPAARARMTGWAYRSDSE
ncbi:MAG: hypothetical protein ACLP41_05120 [Acidimicrobiales bacterium]